MSRIYPIKFSESPFDDLNTNPLDNNIKKTDKKIQEITKSFCYRNFGIGKASLQAEIAALSAIKENDRIPPSKGVVDRINHIFKRTLRCNLDKETENLINRGLSAPSSRLSEIFSLPEASVDTSKDTARSSCPSKTKKKSMVSTKNKIVYTRETNHQFSLVINGKTINFEKASDERNGTFDTFRGIGEHHKVSVKIAEFLPNRNMEALKKETQFLLEMNGSKYVLGASEAVFTGKHQFLIMNEVVGESLVRKIGIPIMNEKLNS
jgi:hypothetical protein